MRWIIIIALCAVAGGAAAVSPDWAYHDDNDMEDDRFFEFVPAHGFPFIGNGTITIPSDEAVTLYVLTANQFAGDAEEQVFARWWNGEEEQWIMGGWVDNVFLGTGENEAGRFHGMPEDAPVMLDLWKIEIGPELTKPGENYYVIQLKAWNEELDEAEQVYLLRDTAENSRNNNLNQSWTDGDYFGHDWNVQITEPVGGDSASEEKDTGF